jgi:hypothetical protein
MLWDAQRTIRLRFCWLSIWTTTDASAHMAARFAASSGPGAMPSLPMRMRSGVVNLASGFGSPTSRRCVPGTLAPLLNCAVRRSRRGVGARAFAPKSGQDHLGLGSVSAP